jgi:outer membrane receptor protein involved in Fe transport
VRELGFEQQTRDIRVVSGTDVRHDLVVRLELLEQRVVVTATRNEAPASLLGNSVTVVGADEIRESHAWGLSDVLRHVPGLHVLQTGAPGGIAALYVRGRSDYAKVLLDGIPLNQPGGYFDFASLSPANIDRIEVVRGPQSALYGSDAIAGVVQIFTRDPEEPTGRPEFELSLEAGNYSQFSAASGVHGRHNGFHYSALVNHRETDNAVPNNYFRGNSVSAMVRSIDLLRLLYLPDGAESRWSAWPEPVRTARSGGVRTQARHSVRGGIRATTLPGVEPPGHILPVTDLPAVGRPG